MLADQRDKDSAVFFSSWLGDVVFGIRFKAVFKALVAALGSDLSGPFAVSHVLRFHIAYLMGLSISYFQDTLPQPVRHGSESKKVLEKWSRIEDSGFRERCEQLVPYGPMLDGGPGNRYSWIMRESLKTAKRIVVKAGTSMLTDSKGRVDRKLVHRLSADVSALRKGGRDVALVSSGAIAFGMDALGLSKRPRGMGTLQACAAVGQGRLMHAYSQSFDKRGLPAAQMLLTRDGLEDRSRFLTARRTFDAVFEVGGVPVVNENDTVATEEIAFGDNDVLSVHTAHLIGADLLIILSDVDGFSLKDGSRVRGVGSISEIDKDLVKHLRERKRETTVGGMRAKLEAARKAMHLGIPLLIVDGGMRGVLERAVRGEDVGTLFSAKAKIQGARKRWIAFTAARRGKVTVDPGALKALSRKKSLLPIGVRGVEGSFEAGDVIEIVGEDGGAVGRGVSAYSLREARRIMGKRSSEIKALLGRKGKDEVIHRDDIVLWS